MSLINSQMLLSILPLFCQDGKLFVHYSSNVKQWAGKSHECDDKKVTNVQVFDSKGNYYTVHNFYINIFMHVFIHVNYVYAAIHIAHIYFTE